MGLEHEAHTSLQVARGEVLNLRGALDYADGSMDLLRGMASVFLSEIPLRMDDIDDAAAEMDLMELAQLVHPVRSMCEAMGGYRCRDVAAMLERAALQNDRDKVAPLTKSLKREVEMLTEDLFRI